MNEMGVVFVCPEIVLHTSQITQIKMLKELYPQPQLKPLKPIPPKRKPSGFSHKPVHVSDDTMGLLRIYCLAKINESDMGDKRDTGKIRYNTGKSEVLQIEKVQTSYREITSIVLNKLNCNKQIKAEGNLCWDVYSEGMRLFLEELDKRKTIVDTTSYFKIIDSGKVLFETNTISKGILTNFDCNISFNGMQVFEYYMLVLKIEEGNAINKVKKELFTEFSMNFRNFLLKNSDQAEAIKKN